MKFDVFVKETISETIYMDSYTGYLYFDFDFTTVDRLNAVFSKYYTLSIYNQPVRICDLDPHTLGELSSYDI